MFLTMLGGSLVVGASLLAAASFSEGTLLALRTAAQIIGWLFLLSTVLGLEVLRRGHAVGIGAAAVTMACGLGVLYLSYFAWGEVRDHPLDYKRIEPSVLAATATLASMPMPAPAPKSRQKPPLKEILAGPVTAPVAVTAPVPADACASLAGVESLQCRRCAGKSGLGWIACQESARLEYCEGRASEDAACPSPIPTSHPG